jgi:hypothetical protein
LRRQVELEVFGQQPSVGSELGIAAQDQSAAIGGGQVHVQHPDGGELVEDGARGQAGGKRAKPRARGDMQAVGEESDEDVRFAAAFEPVIDRKP